MHDGRRSVLLDRSGSLLESRLPGEDYGVDRRRKRPRIQLRGDPWVMTLRVALDEIMKLKVHRSWKNVLTCLLNHRDWRTGYSSPGVELIVEETGLGKRQVQRILGYLEELDGAGKITPMGNTM